VANTAIDSVEMAVDILTQGFSDWSADCPEAPHWDPWDPWDSASEINWGEWSHRNKGKHFLE
jgi:hypothetical protein